MKKLTIALVAAATLGAAGLSATAYAQTTQAVPAALLSERFVSDSEVVAIDPATRKVTLKGADGRTATVTAGPEVKNFAQIKVGDRIRVQYSQTLALALKKGPGVRETDVRKDGAAAAPGEKPAGVAAREVHFVADITKLDATAGTLTVKGAQGRVFELKVKDPAVLKGYKAGDQVEGVFLEVFAIGDIGPAPAKK